MVLLAFFFATKIETKNEHARIIAKVEVILNSWVAVQFNHDFLEIYNTHNT